LKNVFVLLYDGKMFLFEDSDFSKEQSSKIELFLQNVSTEHPEIKKLNDNGICDWFITSVKQQFDVLLKKVDISCVFRIYS